MWKRPHQIWIALASMGAIVFVGFGWLTIKVLELDRQDRLTKLRSEQEQRASVALWRMDSMAMPIIAAEAARPYFVYQPVLTQTQGLHPGDLPQRLPSPLLNQPSAYVNLNFELCPDGTLDSPQLPLEQDRDWALTNGLAPEQLSINTVKSVELDDVLNYAELLSRLPDEFTQSTPTTQLASLNSDTSRSTQDDLPSSTTTRTSSNESPQEFDNGSQSLTRPTAQIGQGAAQYGRGGKLLESPYGNSSQSVTPHSGRQQTSISEQVFREPDEATQQEAQEESMQQALPQLVDLLQSQNDFGSRSNRLQGYAQQAVIEQRSNLDEALFDRTVREGVSRPLWVNQKLLLARRVVRNDETVIQGCWLNWEQLQHDLLLEIQDVLPEATLEPIRVEATETPARALASLPASLQLPAITAVSWEWTPTMLAIAIAWVGLLAAAAGFVYLIMGVTALSERRAAFVSAVTHELRSPLTTFQLYTEMLAGGMVRDPIKQQDYLETLHRESSRLGHLVDNVLAYARLERQPAMPPRTLISTRELLRHMEQRLQAQATLGGQTIVGLDGLHDSSSSTSSQFADVPVLVEPTVIEQILLNLIDNACKYGSNPSSPELTICCLDTGTTVSFDVQDRGRGVASDVRPKLFQPFSKSDHEAARTAPGVGLGLALSRGLARQQGGDLQLLDSSEAGTTFRLVLPQAHTSDNSPHI
ncbi:MAG: HAMP domain-containing sensor histidine kinase [Planctomycetaceae bacterium]